MKNRFLIITPTYNAEDWIERNVESVRSQTHKKFKTVIVNDLSEDRTTEFAQSAIDGDSRFELITNENRSRPLGSTVNGINHLNPADDDIIVILDGDDWLYDSSVLDKLNSVYNKEDCLFTYGSYIDFPHEQRGIFSQKIPQEIIKSNSYRQNQLLASHLKSFRYKLWKRIDHKDLVDFSGAYYPMAGDISYIFPLLEMAGSRAKHIEDILYVYNAYNPLNEHKTDHELQLSIEREIRAKRPYFYAEDLS